MGSCLHSFFGFGSFEFKIEPNIRFIRLYFFSILNSKDLVQYTSFSLHMKQTQSKKKKEQITDVIQVYLLSNFTVGLRSQKKYD